MAGFLIGVGVVASLACAVLAIWISEGRPLRRSSTTPQVPPPL